MNLCDRMAIKLIALDMDGTTLKDNHFSLPSKNRRAITDALARGIFVVPATGRTLSGIPGSIKKITGIRYAITSNGASVTDLYSNEQIYSNLIPSETAVNVLALTKKLKVYAEVYYDGKAYTERGTRPEIIKKNLWLKLFSLFLKREEVGNLADFVGENGNPVEKIELLPDNSTIKDKLEKELKKFSVTVTTSGMNSIEITNHKTSKGEALSHLCSQLNINADEVMAVGDNHNDLEMLNWAHLGVAVENADPAVKRIADYITLTNNNSGVAYAINRFTK